MSRNEDAQSPESEPRRPRRGVFRALVVFIAVVLVALVSPVVLRHMSYFRVRRIEVTGTRYVQPNVLLAVLAIDSTKTIWENLGPLEERVRQHPQVRDAKLSRKLPGTLVLKVVENLPVALITTNGGLQPLDRGGHRLPIDPSRTHVDLPIVSRADTMVLRLLDGLRARDPALFARVNEVRWDEGRGLRVLLSGMTVRAYADCTPARFAEIIPVEQDLARRGQRVSELDLRFRDQIVARIE